MFWQFSSRRLVYIGINASLSEFGVGTYSGADWLKSTGLLVRKKQKKCPTTSGKWFAKQPVAHTCWKFLKHTFFWDTLYDDEALYLLAWIRPRRLASHRHPHTWVCPGTGCRGVLEWWMWFLLFALFFRLRRIVGRISYIVSWPWIKRGFVG